MSGINVIDSDGKIQSFEEATTWHIDDRGQLHLKAGEKQVATFAKDRWQGAGTAEASSPAALHPDLGLEILQQLAEIKSTLS